MFADQNPDAQACLFLGAGHFEWLQVSGRHTPIRVYPRLSAVKVEIPAQNIHGKSSYLG